MADGEMPNDSAKPVGSCPTCKAARSEKYRPFCSKRCADIDLGRWITGRYAIAGGSPDEDEDGHAEAPDFSPENDPEN